MFKNLTILIISPDKWDFLPVSKHHYAMELAKDNDVYFINPTNSKKENLTEKGVKIINQYRQIRGINKLPKLLQKFLMKSEVNSIMNQIEGNKADIIWSFDTSRLYYLDLFNAKIKIAHVVDFSEHFNFNELISSADFCFATSDSITNKMLKLNKLVYKINHGYYSINRTVNNSNSRIEKSTLTGVYIGNLNIKYLDWKAISKIVIHRPDVKFYFIGSLSINKVLKNDKYFMNVYQSKNTHFIKEITPEEVELELKMCDFCFLAYKEKEFPNQLQNPHKVMQYLGSGTPVFASFTYEFKDTNLLFMYNDSERIQEDFDSFLSASSFHFSQESKQKRIDFALNNTYEKQIERIKKIIFEKHV